MQPYRILVVDDEQIVRDAVKILLESQGLRVDLAENSTQALQHLGISRHEYALIIVDISLPDLNGFELAKKIRRFNEDSLIIFHSGDTSKESMKLAWHAGANDYIEKGLPSEDIIKTIQNHCRKYEETSRLLKENTDFSEKEELIRSIGLIGRSDALTSIAMQVKRYQNLKEPILILGETGTGKELIARALHKSSESFFAINCATYQGSTHLLESELFGYEKGSFTGANNMGKVGILETARGGTVFLDEVHRLSPEAQGKLLRVIQEKKIRRVGGLKEYPVDFRIIAAGKAELNKAVELNQFLPDLLYRLNVLTINIPLLRHRKEDIEPLIWHFTKQFCTKYDVKKSFLMKTIRYLENYAWPGNIRELENTVIKLLLDCDQKTIEPKHLEGKFFDSNETSEENLEALDRKHETERRKLIKATLEKSNWNASQAARSIGVPSSTMYDLMSKYQIEKPEKKVS